jgi:microcystin-dependent protein
LSLHDLGETGGSETVTLLESEIPAHAHAMNGQGSNSNLNDPAGAVLARPFGGGSLYKAPAGSPIVSLSDQSLAPAGGDAPHNNMMPYLTFNFCIALQGVFPPRT